MTNLCKWHDFYMKASGPVCFGGDRSYRIAGEFLKDCSRVEDWGAGTCWLRQYIAGEYVGIDGSGPHVEVMADLVDYTSEVEGICLRHVLEHNDEWRAILTNALGSMRKRLVIILSVPLAETDTEVSFDESVGMPHISLCQKELMEMVMKLPPAKDAVRADITQIGTETYVFVSMDVEHEQAVAKAVCAIGMKHG